MEFPNTFPNGCPPDQAAECNGTYFHVLKENPPGESDLKSFHEKNRKLNSQLSCPCMPYGLSVFSDREDAVFMQGAMPKLGNFVGELRLNPPDGKVIPTPGQRPSHNTWWPSVDCDRRRRVVQIERVA
jgi:hypothetical protein